MKTKTSVNVRLGAGLNYPIISTEPADMIGTIDNPLELYQDGYYWTVIKYNDGNHGWSVISVPSWIQPAGCWIASPISMEQAARYALNAGFSRSNDQAATIVAIAWAESSGNPSACLFNAGSSPSWDRGIVQINSRWHPEVTDYNAFSSSQAFVEAYRISSQGTNFGPWSTYNNGAYRTYLSAARDAVSRV